MIAPAGADSTTASAADAWLKFKAARDLSEKLYGQRPLRMHSGLEFVGFEFSLGVFPGDDGWLGVRVVAEPPATGYKEGCTLGSESTSLLRFGVNAQIGSTTLVPTHMSRLLALPPDTRSSTDLPSLRLVFQTGSACPVEVKRAMIDWWGPVFLEAYGGTEVGVTCSISSQDWLGHPGSVGRAVNPYEAVVVDDDGTEVPAGEEGRLYFRDTTGRGIVYHDDPERSAAAHLSPGLFTLGEIGRVDGDGWVYVTDRASDMVVTGGVNVYPAEAEAVMMAHPAVTDVAGVGIPDDDLGEIMVALVVLDPSTPPPPTGELLTWCRERLPAYKCPRQLMIVGSLDRNALGKLNKRELRARFIADRPTDGPGPRTRPGTTTDDQP